jgi:uncharacterized SAM-binding protein YcdF (DUF218 family)
MRLRPGSRRGSALIPILAAVLLLALLWFSRGPILSRMGTFLNVGEPPRKADVALVLAGGWAGERVMKAADLVRQGYVPSAIISGSGNYYDVSECDAAIAFAVHRGVSPSIYTCVFTRGKSTREEAVDTIRELRRVGARKVLLVSVNSHLRRARRIYSEMAPDLEIHYIGAENPGFKLAEWYKSREGRKAMFYELTKFVTSPFGI